MLQDVNANLVCNDKILMQVGIETVRNSILLWLPIEQGGMGYADNFHSQALIYLDREQVVIPRKGIGEVVFGDLAGATGVISWLGVGGAIGATVPGTNAAIVTAIAWGAAWSSGVAGVGCVR